MSSTQTLKEQISYLSSLMKELAVTRSLADQVHILEREYLVEEFLSSAHFIALQYPTLTLVEKEAIASICAIGQAPIVFQIPSHLKKV